MFWCGVVAFWIDLTMYIDKNTSLYPGSPKVEIKQIATVEKDGWNEKQLNFTSHFGTHIDAPSHMIKDGKTLDDFSLETFIGQAIVIDARDLSNLKSSAIKHGDIVFFYTGHTENISDNFFKKYQRITKDTAQLLIDKNVKIFGLDSFTPDDPPFDVHKLFFKNNILIVENLVNLKPLVGKRFECIILPLKIEGADGAPCRVIAKEK